MEITGIKQNKMQKNSLKLTLLKRKKYIINQVKANLNLTDEEAIGSDFKAIGQDIENAMAAFRKDMPKILIKKDTSNR